MLIAHNENSMHKFTIFICVLFFTEKITLIWWWWCCRFQWHYDVIGFKRLNIKDMNEDFCNTEVIAVTDENG